MAINGQFGLKSESTYATAVVVDTFHAGYLSGNPVREQPPLVSKGIRKNRRTPTCISTGAKSVAGSMSVELYSQPMACLLRHMFGTIGTTGSGPYVHTASPGTTDDKSFTAQFGIEGTAGTVHPFTFKGTKLEGWTLKGTAGEIATLDLDLVAQDYVTATALASPSYLSGCPFTFVQGSVSVAGSALAEVKSFELVAARPLRKEHFMGSALIGEPIETGQTEYTVTVETEFQDLTIHDLANTGVAVVLTFTDGTNSLVVTLNVWVNAHTPEVSGIDDLNSFTFDGMAYGSTDAVAVTAVLTNSEASAA